MSWSEKERQTTDISHKSFGFCHMWSLYCIRCEAFTKFLPGQSLTSHTVTKLFMPCHRQSLRIMVMSDSRCVQNFDEDTVNKTPSDQIKFRPDSKFNVNINGLQMTIFLVISMLPWPSLYHHQQTKMEFYLRKLRKSDVSSIFTREILCSQWKSCIPLSL